MYICIQIVHVMSDLQILVSKKGTKVVTATNLHYVLQLPNHHYGMNLKKWLSDVYEFRDGIRKPAGMQDYAKRPIKGNLVVEDYYLSIEFAKLIVLQSRSKFKQKYARLLMSLEDRVESAELLNKEQVVAIIDIVRAMGLVSCQESCERGHQQVYASQNDGSHPAEWWKHRAEILGYSAESLREQMKALGKTARGKSQREMLIHLDKYEIVRAAVIDLFMAMGKTERYARYIGDVAKSFAQEMQVDIFDDRNASMNFMPEAEGSVAQEVRSLERSGVLAAWG